jgi:hypothetical protein
VLRDLHCLGAPSSDIGRTASAGSSKEGGVGSREPVGMMRGTFTLLPPPECVPKTSSRKSVRPRSERDFVGKGRSSSGGDPKRFLQASLTQRVSTEAKPSNSVALYSDDGREVPRLQSLPPRNARLQPGGRKKRFDIGCPLRHFQRYQAAEEAPTEQGTLVTEISIGGGCKPL